MAKSPFERAAEEGLNQEQSGSSSASGKGKRPGRKRKPKSTKPAKNRQKKVKKRYSKAREEAQLHGVIPTTPEGAVHPERVDPATQSEGAKGAVQTAQLMSQAIRNGWDVPKERRAQLVDEMTRVVLDPDTPTKTRVAAFNALRLADKDQWERDNPREAGLARGAAQTTAVSLEANVLAVTALREAFQNASDLGGGGTALPTSAQSCAPGDRRFDGEVEAGAALTTNQRGAGEGVADSEQSNEHNGPIPARQEPTLLDILSRMGAAPLA